LRYPTRQSRARFDRCFRHCGYHIVNSECAEAKVVWLLLLLLIGAGAIGSQLALGSLVASLYPPSIHATAMGLSGGMGRLFDPGPMI
jgi:hypothetical protein